MAKRKHSESSLVEIDEAEEEFDFQLRKKRKIKTSESSERSSDMGFSPFEERDLNDSLIVTHKGDSKFQTAFDEINKQMQRCEDDLESTGTLLMPKRYHTESLQSPASSIQLTPSNTSKFSPCLASTQPSSIGVSPSHESSKFICAQKLQFGLPDKDHMNSNFRKYIQRNYIRLKENLDPDGIADRFCEYDIIGDADRRKIEEAGYSDIKSDILLKFLVRQLEKIPEEDKTFVEKVFGAFEKEKCTYLLKSFENTDLKCKDYVEENVQNDQGIWKEKLIQFLKQRGDEIDAKQIIDKLLQNEVLEFDEHENIQSTQFKPDKLKYLVKYICKKTLKEFCIFVQVLEEESPHLCKDLKNFEMMDISTSSEDDLPTVSVLSKITNASNSGSCSRVSEFKLSLQGNGQDIEKMIVENCASGSNQAMTEEMMELGTTDIKNCEFSCIRLTLKHLSNRSQMQLYSKLKESPEQFSKILRHLIKKEHFRLMRERGIHLIEFKLEIKWPDGIITRDVIAENYCFLKENIEPNKFVDLIKSANAPNHVLDVITSTKPRASRCSEFLLFLVNDENSPIHDFHAKLKDLKMDDIINVLMDSRKELISRMCSCRLTKSILVKHFSELVHEMKGMNDILEVFSNFAGFDEQVKAYFDELRSSHKTSSNDKEKQSLADAFLRKVLDMSKNEVSEEVCLLEEEVRKTDQGQTLLKRILEKPPTTEDCVITTKDIRRNRSFLISQLEPRRFLDMISDIDGIDDTRDKILSSLPKQTRSIEFLRVLENNKAALEKFGPELKRLHLTKIIDFLSDARTQGSEELKICNEDIKRNSRFLKEELEPRNFLNMLREMKGTDDDIEKILSSSPRRMKCDCFYEFLSNASEKDLEQFQLELRRRDLQHVIAFLVNSRPGRYQDKTQLKEALVDTYKYVIDEIEPICMQNIFVEREVYTEKEFKEICSAPSRRSRAFFLLNDTVKGPVSKARCFMNALDAVGYVSLAKLIRKEIDTYKKCPRLFKKALGITDSYCIEGQFQIEMLKENSSTSSDSFELPSQTIEAGEYVQEWLDKMDQKEKDQEQITFTLDCEANEDDSLNRQSEKCSSSEKSKHCFRRNFLKQSYSCHDSLNLDYPCRQRLDETASVFSKDTRSPSSGFRMKIASTRRAWSTSSSESTIIYSNMNKTEKNDD